MAAVPNTYSQTFTTFVSSTLDDRRKDVINQIWTDTPIMAWAKTKGRTQPGGKKIFINVEYGRSTSNVKKGLSRGSTLDLTKQEIITEAWYEWDTYGSGVIRYRDDDLENSGKYAIFNLLQSYEDNMMNSFREVIEQDLLSDNGTSDDGWHGLQYLIEDITNVADGSATAAGSNTVGNINRADNAWWNNWGRNMTGKEPIVWIEHYMREQCDNVMAYSGQLPEVILGHYNAKNLYEDAIGQTLRTTDVNLGDIGYRTVEYKGIPFLTSNYFDTDNLRMYFIGRDALEMTYDPRMWFRATDWKEPLNQPFDYAKQVLAKGQFLIKKPRHTSVLYNING